MLKHNRCSWNVKVVSKISTDILAQVDENPNVIDKDSNLEDDDDVDEVSGPSDEKK